MLQEYKIPPHEIQEVIRAAERRNGFTLCMEDFDFLTFAISQFIHQATDKFIDGAKRHYQEDDPTFVASVPHLVEIRKESIDSWFYILAEQVKQSKAKQ
jgi:hypothetical protein